MLACIALTSLSSLLTLLMCWLYVILYAAHYTNSLWSHLHVNITNLLNIMCTLVATCMILDSLDVEELIKTFSHSAKKNQKMSICNLLVLGTLGSQLIKPKNLPGEWSEIVNPVIFFRFFLIIYLIVSTHKEYSISWVSLISLYFLSSLVS